MEDCLRKYFQKRIHKQPAWLDPSDKEAVDQQYDTKATAPDFVTRIPDHHEASSGDSESESDDVDMYVNDVRSKKETLETRDLRYKHLVDINLNRKTKHDSVRGVEFHPKSKVGMVTLNKGRIDLFEIDGEKNNHLHRIKTPYLSNQKAKFTPLGELIVVASEKDKGKFYTHDMNKSKSTGHWLRIGKELKQISDFELSSDYMIVKDKGSRDVLLLSGKTFEIVRVISVNDPVEKIKFLSDSEIMIAGENNSVYIYDIRKSTAFKHKFQDEGTVHIASLAFSNSSNLLSIGSDTGIVNTYKLTSCLEHNNPKPIATHSNLTTKIGILEYNHSGELLVMGSGASHGAFRLIHSYSGKVYRNFPSKNHKYGHPADVAFSPKGGYLALGCTNGQANLIRIPFYRHY